LSCRTNLCPANSPFAFLTVMLAQAWDMAAEMCLLQLPALLNGDPEAEFRPSPFFAEQLTAFELWLAHGSAMKQPPEQLPIVLQASLVPCMESVLCHLSMGSVLPVQHRHAKQLHQAQPAKVYLHMEVLPIYPFFLGDCDYQVWIWRTGQTGSVQ
jgi:hypothetical protein